MSTPKMNAILYRRYGSADVLDLQQVEKPEADNDGILVRILATSVNPADWHYMTGRPYFMRLLTGLRKPKKITLGVDMAGRVEAVGKNVTKFKPGDEVFGWSAASFAEYVKVTEGAIVSKPSNVSFEQGAAVAIAALTALQGLRDKGNLQPGHKVLINGAAGGVGTFAVQIAKALGAEVTGVCSTRNVDMVRSIGADHVIDYTKDNFTKDPKRYDVVLDTIGNHSLAASKRVLNRGGKLVIVGGPVRHMLGATLRIPFTTRRTVGFIAKLTNTDLLFMRELLGSGKVVPVIDRNYSLSDTADALTYLGQGHAQGKVILTP
jgi:NADPH:quinone reductase-like Zn-dependent oxidoreductase